MKKLPKKNVYLKSVGLKNKILRYLNKNVILTNLIDYCNEKKKITKLL